MNRFRSIVLAGLAILMAAGIAWAQQGNGQGNGGLGGGPGGGNEMAGIEVVIQGIPSAPLSAAERAGLIYMYEEEKLARDVYNALYDKWKLPVFRNIASSEETHMESIALLLDRYGIPYPVKADAVGVFSDPALKKLYADLTAAGKKSLSAGLNTGALIEDLDIADLLKRIAESDNDDIRIVYQNLANGSRNHLRSFTDQLARYNAAYSPSYIAKDYFNRIMGSPRETASLITDPEYRF